jgi:hypothetical protein
VVMSLLVLGLVGGAAELSRCPQVVSFSGGAAPLHEEAQSFAVDGVGYQAVAFHPSAGAVSTVGVAHETLLKASMRMVPSTEVPQHKTQVAAKRHRPVHAASLMRVKQNRAMQQTQRMERWVVLTSWEESSQPRMVLTVSGGRVFSSSFAAVPTEGGWLVIQL